ARRGIEVERKSRTVTIFTNEIVALETDELTLAIHCSKGTYVRTIVEEIGELLGCGAHVCALRRLAAGPFDERDLVTFELVRRMLEEGGSAALDRALKPIASAVRHWPAVTLSDATSYYVRQGQPVIVPHAPTTGWVQIFEAETADTEGTVLGVGA